MTNQIIYFIQIILAGGMIWIGVFLFASSKKAKPILSGILLFIAGCLSLVRAIYLLTLPV